jgi:hypothetical protein
MVMPEAQAHDNENKRISRRRQRLERICDALILTHRKTGGRIGDRERLLDRDVFLSKYHVESISNCEATHIRNTS